jgi:HD domain
MESVVAGEIDRAQVRLAELVAALSLGIDLGFGQPMEHVLRQCLIALRLAEGIGLDEEQRAIVYYTALLINVGCHSDAHEQAKWFGDDIAVKSIKYDHEPRSLRMAATGIRFLGSGHPPLHRFRLGLEFALSGHREVDDMIAHHAAIARTMAEQLFLPDEVVDALGAAYERWDGRGWPGELEGVSVPLAARVAHVAEFVEVANRIGGVEAAKQLARERRGGDFDPALADLVEAEGDVILSDLDTVGVWDAVIDAEPALAVVLTGELFDAALGAIANFVDLALDVVLNGLVLSFAAENQCLLELPLRGLTATDQFLEINLVPGRGGLLVDQFLVAPARTGLVLALVAFLES